VCAWLGAVSAGIAQTPSEQASSKMASWLIGPFVGYGNNSVTDHFLGVTPGRDHYFFGIEAVSPLVSFGPGRLSYAIQFVPAMVIQGTEGILGYSPPGVSPMPGIAYAIGLAPFGLELGVLISSWLDIHGAAAAGALWFTKPFPVDGAEPVNFTLEVGGGFRLLTREGEWIEFGYKFHHLSNAYTGIINPGLDGHLLFLGYKWSVTLPR
jgi:hypothetical protein